LARRLTRVLDEHDELARPLLGLVSYYNSLMEIHPSARKHGIADEDIRPRDETRVRNRRPRRRHRLYVGPARSADLLEVATIVRDDGSELAIHAMRMRPNYRRLLPGG
jgi:hypothetical protein